jgi:hypothetical protein
MSQGVISQVRLATRNITSLAVGCLLGGFVPLATYIIAHNELKQVFSLQTLLVVGGLLYSAKTVWQWSNMAFECKYKATGFVLLLEGVMVLSNTQWLSLASLSYLIGINAIATGCLLAKRDNKDSVRKNNTKSTLVSNDNNVTSSRKRFKTAA